METSGKNFGPHSKAPGSIPIAPVMLLLIIILTNNSILSMIYYSGAPLIRGKLIEGFLDREAFKV